MAKSINDITLGNKSRYQGIYKRACIIENVREWKTIPFSQYNHKLESGDTKGVSTTKKHSASNDDNDQNKSYVIPLKNNDGVINKYQNCRIGSKENKLKKNMKCCLQMRTRTKKTNIDKKSVTSSHSAKNKKDKIIPKTSFKLNSNHTLPIESNMKNKNLSLYDEIHSYFKELLSSTKNNKYIGSEKDIVLTRKENNNFKQKKSSITKTCNDSNTASKPRNITNKTIDNSERKVKANVAQRGKRQLEKMESKTNAMMTDEHHKAEDVNLDKYCNDAYYVKENESVDFTSIQKNIVQVLPRYVKDKNPFQLKLNNDIICFFVNLKSNKDGMCLEWAKKKELQDNSKCKNKSKPKKKCVNYEKQLKLAISDDCVINNTFYERSKQYFKDISSKFNKCFMFKKSAVPCKTLNDVCYQVLSKSNNNIICECNIDKKKTPSKGSVELEYKKSLLKQNRSCNTFKCCKPSFKSRLITALQNLFTSKNCDPEVTKKKLDASVFQIKIDPVNMKVINKREVRKKIKLQNKKVNKYCSPSKSDPNSAIKGKAYVKNEISPTASDCKGPLFEIKLDHNNMRILNLSEILHKIRRLDCSRPKNDVPKTGVQNSVVKKCNSRQLRDIKSKISCLWTQFTGKSEKTATRHKYNSYNTNLYYTNPFGKKSNYRKRRKRKVIKSYSNKKSKVRKKKHKRKKPKPIHKKSIKKRRTRRAKKHKKKVKQKHKKLIQQRTNRQRKRNKRLKLKVKKKKYKKKKDDCRRHKKKHKLKKKRVNTCCRELSKFLGDYLFCISPNPKPKRCKKPQRRRRKRCEHIKYHCKVGHLRKSEISCLWLYIVCPSLYRSYLFFRSTLRNIGRLLLIMLALIMWCPFVLVFELCRIFCCLR